MLEAAEALLAEHAELERRLADPQVHADQALARRLARRYASHGLARPPHETAAAWAARVETAHPGSGLPALSHRFSDIRYAGSDSDTASLLADLRRHRPTPGVRP